jgi:RimJ/RimL family protein N-acetyltransferase
MAAGRQFLEGAPALSLHIDDRTLLRLHIEAVWDVSLPFLTQNDVDLSTGGKLPPWLLYVAQLASERVCIWRPDVDEAARQALLQQAERAFTLSTEEAWARGIGREIAFKFTEQPAMDMELAQQLAHLITPDEYAQVESFEPGAAEYYFAPERRPLYGVSVEGRLLSIAHSSRRTVEACELGIDTVPEARRRGYAIAATLLWTRAIIKERRIPFYSALAENAASLALAHKAGYRAFARGVSFTSI